MIHIVKNIVKNVATQDWASFISIELNHNAINLDLIKDAIDYLTNKSNNPECNGCYYKPSDLFIKIHEINQVHFVNYCTYHALAATCENEDCVYVKFLFEEICSNKDYDKILNSINVLRKSLLLR